MFFLGNCLSGGMAGATSLLFVYPLDFGRTRLAADVGAKKSREFTGLFDCMKKIAISDGLKGLYRGFWLSTITIFFYRAIYFGIYDTGKEILFDDPKKTKFLESFVFAQLSSSISGIIIYPFDTIRRRLMM